MPFSINMPKLSPTMEEGTIVKWHKRVGEAIQTGDVLVEVATDKATIEYQALDEGWLRQILIQEGQEAAVNQPIAILTVEENESLEGYQPLGDAQALKKEPKIEILSEVRQVVSHTEIPLEFLSTKQENVASQSQDILATSSTQNETRILASPLAKKIAKEKGLDLARIRGSGPNQRIMSRDLANAQSFYSVSSSPREVPLFPAGSFEEQPLSPMRKVIGQRLQESKSFIPHFYVTQSIDAEPLVTIREQLKTQEIKFSINDFIVKACGLALRQSPAINIGFNSKNQSIIRFKTIDIAIAVSLETGLITPIVRHVDYKDLKEISEEIHVLAQRARQGKLNPQEYQGGSFTITNLGMYGINEFQAILNPPQAAILAISGIQDVPVVRQGLIAPGKILNVTLSVDHRVIDGKVAAQFLQILKKILENPAILLIN